MTNRLFRYTWESARGFDAESVLHTLPVCIGVDVSTFIYRTHLSKVVPSVHSPTGAHIHQRPRRSNSSSGCLRRSSANCPNAWTWSCALQVRSGQGTAGNPLWHIYDSNAGEKIMTDGQPPFGICFINHGVVDVISRKGERRQSLR